MVPLSSAIDELIKRSGVNQVGCFFIDVNIVSYYVLVKSLCSLVYCWYITTAVDSTKFQYWDLLSYNVTSAEQARMSTSILALAARNS